MDNICQICGNEMLPDATSCPSCGFRPVETTQSFKPVSLDDGEMKAGSEKPQSEAELRIIRGPQIETIFHLEAGTFTIGRNPKCDIFLNDMTVSREHAQIYRQNDRFAIRDSNSFNGVWVNNENIEEAVLQEGDIIQIGAFCLLYKEKA